MRSYKFCKKKQTKELKEQLEKLDQVDIPFVEQASANLTAEIKQENKTKEELIRKLHKIETDFNNLQSKFQDKIILWEKNNQRKEAKKIFKERQFAVLLGVSQLHLNSIIRHIQLHSRDGCIESIGDDDLTLLSTDILDQLKTLIEFLECDEQQTITFLQENVTEINFSHFESREFLVKLKTKLAVNELDLALLENKEKSERQKTNFSQIEVDCISVFLFKILGHHNQCHLKNANNKLISFLAELLGESSRPTSQNKNSSAKKQAIVGSSNKKNRTEIDNHVISICKSPAKNLKHKKITFQSSKSKKSKLAKKTDFEEDFEDDTLENAKDEKQSEGPVLITNDQFHKIENSPKTSDDNKNILNIEKVNVSMHSNFKDEDSKNIHTLNAKSAKSNSIINKSHKKSSNPILNYSMSKKLMFEDGSENEAKLEPAVVFDESQVNTKGTQSILNRSSNKILFSEKISAKSSLKHSNWQSQSKKKNKSSKKKSEHLLGKQSARSAKRQTNKKETKDVKLSIASSKKNKNRSVDKQKIIKTEKDSQSKNAFDFKFDERLNTLENIYSELIENALREMEPESPQSIKGSVQKSGKCSLADSSKKDNSLYAGSENRSNGTDQNINQALQFSNFKAAVYQQLITLEYNHSDITNKIPESNGPENWNDPETPTQKNNSYLINPFFIKKVIADPKIEPPKFDMAIIEKEVPVNFGSPQKEEYFPCSADVQDSASKMIGKIQDKALFRMLSPMLQDKKMNSKNQKMIAKMAIRGFVTRTSKLMTSYFSGISKFGEDGFSKTCVNDGERASSPLFEQQSLNESTVVEESQSQMDSVESHSLIADKQSTHSPKVFQQKSHKKKSEFSIQKHGLLADLNSQSVISVNKTELSQQSNKKSLLGKHQVITGSQISKKQNHMVEGVSINEHSLPNEIDSNFQTNIETQPDNRAPNKTRVVIHPSHKKTNEQQNELSIKNDSQLSNMVPRITNIREDNGLMNTGQYLIQNANLTPKSEHDQMIKPMTGKTDSCDYELRTNLGESVVKTDGDLNIKVISVNATGIDYQDFQLQVAIDQSNSQTQSFNPDSPHQFHFFISKQKTAVFRILENSKTLASKNYPLENLLFTERVLVNDKIEFLVNGKEMIIAFEFEWTANPQENENDSYDPPKFES